MQSVWSLTPIAPLDATLALLVPARRKAQLSLRHLLPSAPLLGRPVRRLTRLSSTAASGTPLRWRATKGEHERVSPAPGVRAGARDERWRGLGAHPPMASGLGTTAVPVRAQSTVPTATTANADTSRPAPLRERELASRASADARGFAVAPALVWFARWRDVRQMRLVQERRSAAVLSSAARPVPWGRGAIREAQPRPDNAIVAEARPSVGSATADAGEPKFALTALPATAPWATFAAAIRSPVGSSVTPNAWQGDAGNVQPLGRDVRPIIRYRGTVEVSDEDGPPIAALVTSSGPAAAAAAYALDAVRRELPDRVAAQVQQNLDAALKRVEPPQPAPDMRQPDSPRIDDRTVSALLGRMRALQRAEQFRHGQLR